MAIIKRPSRDGTKYQVKLQGSDGSWISETFDTRLAAEIRDTELKRRKNGGTFISNEIHHLTVDQYFEAWNRDTAGTRASESWRHSQVQMYRAYVQPILGSVRVQAVTPAHILRVLQAARRIGRANQTIRHVYNLLHKVFRDAVETHEVLDRNPVKRREKPQLEEREADFLEVAEARALLGHVRGKPYELAIWLGVFVGLRVGEVQALLWRDVDLERGIIRIRRTYVRRERRFKEYPKGRRWHEVAVPPELLDLLRQERVRSFASEYVVSGPEPRMREGRPPLCYESYLFALKAYCKELGLKQLATHGLRHSTSALWMEHGASKDDMRLLFAHSDQKVTERYLHYETARHLSRIANVIQLFPPKAENNSRLQRFFPNLPNTVDEEDGPVQNAMLSTRLLNQFGNGEV